ncbi:helix-turn-helix domain-containing protein [Thomasclavelia spiroformis]|uniref:winged helix-turn-helix transcriptional regulator n=1 Tax=Thomasclavelia spiroformis TaxID=29348 RepID=UPI00311A6DFB
MKDCIKPNMNFEETGFAYSMSLISGKYKLPILYSLSFYGPFRYNELKRFLDPISFKTLTSNLKELEECKLIIRKEYQEIPPKVEYFLSDKGKSLMPILDQLCDWGEKINKNNKK